MSDAFPAGEIAATPREQAHLEVAHHEICTALTVLQSNVELVRVGLRREMDASTHIEVHHHLVELDMAVERLKRLAAQMRTWHAGDPRDGGGEIGARPDTSLLP